MTTLSEHLARIRRLGVGDCMKRSTAVCRRAQRAGVKAKLAKKRALKLAIAEEKKRASVLAVGELQV